VCGGKGSRLKRIWGAFDPGGTGQKSIVSAPDKWERDEGQMV